jgi:hypothetical protein
MVKTHKPKPIIYSGHALLAEPKFSIPFFGKELIKYGGIDHIRRYRERVIGQDQLRSVLSAQDHPQLPNWLLALEQTDDQDSWVRISVNYLSKRGYKMARRLNFGRDLFRNIPSKKDSLSLISVLRKENAGLGVVVDGLTEPHKLLNLDEASLTSYGVEMNRIIRTELGLPPETEEGTHTALESGFDPSSGRRK